MQTRDSIKNDRLTGIESFYFFLLMYKLILYQYLNYYMSNNFRPILYNKLLYKMGQDLLNIHQTQYRICKILYVQEVNKQYSVKKFHERCHASHSIVLIEPGGRSSHQGEVIPGFNVCHVPGGDDDGEGEKDHRADAPVQPENCKPNQTNQPYVVFNL